MDRNAKSLAFQPGAEKPVADNTRWRQQVRLECLKAASARVVASGAAYQPANVIVIARSFEYFVIGD